MLAEREGHGLMLLGLGTLSSGWKYDDGDDDDDDDDGDGNDGDDGGWGWDAEQSLERCVIRTFDTASRDYETVGITYIRYSSIGILILGRSHVK